MRFHFRLAAASIAASALALSAFMLSGSADSQPAQPNPFTKIATVLQHPRCMNCHPRDDHPRQGADRHVHTMSITRGADNLGAAGARCSACHGEANNPSGVPGAPHWHLAPISMGWQGLTVTEICTALKNPKLNGNRSLAQLVDHVSNDELVLWGWAPGKDVDGKDREPVPIPHDEFVGLVKAWAAADGACP